jgi:hypothetical protein
VSLDALAGTQVLVDQDGWMRAAWRPGDAEDWTDPNTLAARLRDIQSHPIAVNMTGAQVHHH